MINAIKALLLCYFYIGESMAVTQWTPQMIEQIRSGFLKGLEIKAIAAFIGKTPGSVNKALSRFGIRRSQQVIAFRAQCNRLPNVPKEKSVSGADKWFRKFLKNEMEKWVAFDEVIKYLGTQNIRVVALSKQSSALNQHKFFVGAKQCNALQVLLIANKLRAEQNLSTFFVNNLSW